MFVANSLTFFYSRVSNQKRKTKLFELERVFQRITYPLDTTLIFFLSSLICETPSNQKQITPPIALAVFFHY